MKTIAEQIVEARKAAGMTQVQLAEAVHVTRSTISHWEVGRHEPDLETLQLLASVLNTRFILEEDSKEEASADLEMSSDSETEKTEFTTDSEKVQPADTGNEKNEEAPAAEMARESVPLRSRPETGKWRIACLILAVCLVLTGIVVQVFRSAHPEQRAYADKDEPSVVYHAEDFLALPAREEGQAYLTITSSSHVEGTSDSALWLFTFTLTEDQGAAFDVERIDHFWLTQDGAVKTTYTAADLLASGWQTHIPAWGAEDFVGGLRYPAKLDGVAIRAYGTDDKGHAQVYSAYLPYGEN